MAKLNSFRELRVYQELRRLHLVVHEDTERLSEWRGMTRTGHEVREGASDYGVRGQSDERAALTRISAEVMTEFPEPPPSTLHLPPST